MENTRTRTTFDLSAPENRADPYPIYAAMRAEAPIHWNEQANGWLICRYEDVLAGLHNPFISSNRIGTLLNKLPPALQDNLSRWPLLLDPPVHTTLRKLIAAAFVPRQVAAMRQKIEGLVDELLDAALKHDPGEMEFMSAFANPLPIIVIADLLGVDRGDRAMLKDWSDAIASFFGSASKTVGIIEETNTAVLGLSAYFKLVLEARQVNPQNDLISMLVQAEVDGERLSEQDLLAICTMLIFGGHETTTNLIANSVLTLIRYPDQMALLRAKPDLMPQAVQEVLRFESPVQRLGRVTREDVLIGGLIIPANQPVYLMLASANRDEQQFACPDLFDILRTDGKHLAFGNGIHYCVGVSLGALETEVALERILGRLHKLTVRKGLFWKDNLSFRALESLPIGFEQI